jgi:quercetin dioxygenase-like cupin family protein
MKLHHIPDTSLPRLAGIVALGAILAVASSPALAAGEHHTAIAADEVTFNPGPPTLPAGAEIAVLLGSPAEEGPFVIRLKFPAGYDIPPHRHPKEEHVTVLSGGFGMSTGETLDRSVPLLPQGSFVRIPVGEAHFAWTKEETVVQLNGNGPFGVEYVNAADDPRNN